MRIGALIPIRLASERLPGKALMPIADRPVIAHLLDRVFASRYLSAENVIVCTTQARSDDALEDVVKTLGACLFRGSTENIIDRFYNAANFYQFDVVIQVDGDDPCADPLYMDLCMERLLNDERLDIVVGERLPLGLASKAIRVTALNKVFAHHLTTKNDTGFIYYFTKTGLCNVATVGPIQADHYFPQARLTLDYPEDLAFFRRMFSVLYRPGSIFTITDIVHLLRESPDILAINQGMETHYWKRTKELAQLDYQFEGETRRINL